jgi:uncharacterized membrane protein
MGNKLSIILLFVIASQISPVWAETTPQEIIIGVQSDGITRLGYLFESDITSLQTNISLLGESYNDLFVINEDGLPLEYTDSEDGLIIYSLGSSLVNLTYLTSELTGKIGVIWSLGFIAPISTGLVLPVGATVISLNVIPLEIDSESGKTVLIMPAGQLEIQYTLNIIDSEQLSEAAIEAAEEAIQTTLNNGIIVTEAQALLTEAKAFFQQGNYFDAEEKATQTVELVDETVEEATMAEARVTAAETAVQIARESGKTIGLEEAEELLRDARSGLQSGNYEQAVIYAEQALGAALKAEKSRNNNLLLGAGLIAALVIGAYFFYQRKPIVEPAQVDIEIDLERLFDEHPELRMDDREVLKYLAENGGEAFAYDIRERFDIPRTSAWRMIQRLQRYEVVDERKIGGQSLIRIIEEYRREPQ